MPRGKAKVQTKSKTASKNKKVDPEESEEEEEVTTKSKRSTSSTSNKSTKSVAKTKVAPKATKATAAKTKATAATAAKGKGKGKAAAAPKGKGKGKKQEESEDEEEEEEEEEKPKRGRAASKTSKGKKEEPKSKLQAKKDSKAKAKGKKQDDEEEDEMEEEEDKKKASKGAKGKRGRAKSQDKDLDDEAEDAAKSKKQQKLDLNNIDVQVDEHCPLNSGLEVYIKDKKKIYDAKLNQSNVNANNNKFYVIQVLQSKSKKGDFYIYNRWGRVGVKGQDKFMGPMTEAAAIKEYDSKLHEKSVKGDYRLLELDYTKEVPEEEKKAKIASSSKTTTLKKSVADFINLIFDTTMATKQMESIGYDAKKLPLGKLSKNNIEKGYKILNDLLKVIEKKGKGDLAQLSNDFYSYIPHDVGFKNMSTMTIKDEETVKKKLELLDSLSNIKMTYDLLEQKGAVDNVIDSNYKKLKCQIDPVEKGSKDFKMIEQYINNTKENSKVSILNAYKIERDGEYDRYTKNINNKLLLWHGSRLANFVGILSQGLRIAPPEAPASGYRFGKGIYLADMFSKSHGYCASYGSDGVFCIMLCEGACGTFNELLHDDFNASSLPKGKHSTKALGHRAPPESSYQEIEKGIKVPLGKPEKTKHQNSSCYDNEFIIYDVKQVRIRYLIWMKDDRY